MSAALAVNLENETLSEPLPPPVLVDRVSDPFVTSMRVDRNVFRPTEIEAELSNGITAKLVDGRNSPHIFPRVESITLPGNLLYGDGQITTTNLATNQISVEVVNNSIRVILDQYLGTQITTGTTAAITAEVQNQFNRNFYTSTTTNLLSPYSTDDIEVTQYGNEYNIQVSNRYLYDSGWGGVETSAARISRTMKENMRSSVQRNRTHLDWSNPTPAELKARETLREMLTEAQWRGYVANAFIMVRGASNNWYQIFGRRGERIRVYRDGKQIQSICIHTDDKCPPTDHVLNIKIMVEIDEESVLKGGNIAQISHYEKPKLHVVKAIPLLEAKKAQAFKKQYRTTGTSYTAATNQIITYASAC